MVTSYTKMGWNCDSDREKRKDNSKIYTDSEMDSSSIRETGGFAIQTRDVRNPPEALMGAS